MRRRAATLVALGAAAFAAPSGAHPDHAHAYAEWPKAERNSERYIKRMLVNLDSRIERIHVDCKRSGRRRFDCRGRGSVGAYTCWGKGRTRVDRRGQVRRGVIDNDLRC